jgi:NAD(P)-dependent dehydrogenase (short-subunit alcohol dehydrogenase family)
MTTKCATWVDQTVKRFGRLDVAVNNVGTEGHPCPMTEQTQESYAAVLTGQSIVVDGAKLPLRAKHSWLLSEMPSRAAAARTISGFY